MKTHFTWSIENNDRCPTCDEKTALVVALNEMKIDSEDPRCEENFGTVEVYEEISGHFCLKCRKLVSLSLNT